MSSSKAGTGQINEACGPRATSLTRLVYTVPEGLGVPGMLGSAEERRAGRGFMRRWDLNKGQDPDVPAAERGWHPGQESNPTGNHMEPCASFS